MVLIIIQKEKAPISRCFWLGYQDSNLGNVGVRVQCLTAWRYPIADCSIIIPQVPQDVNTFFEKISKNFFSYFLNTASHSFSLKPTSTKPSPTAIGLLTSIPSVASNCSFSSSVIAGSLSFSSILLYSRPLVLKKRFISRPLFSYHSLSSS